jgi:putative ABC transport system permease protein
VLAALGAVGGVLLARWVLSSILALGSGNLPRAADVAIDGRVLAFTLGVSLLAALICGVAPAFFAGTSLDESLKESGRTTGGLKRRRLRRMLVVAEIALAVVLSVGAGLLLRSLDRLLQVHPGFQTGPMLAIEVHIWGLSRTPDQRAAFFEQTIDRITEVPGVVAAGAVSALPFHDNPISPNVALTIEGRPAPLPGQEPTAHLNTATADALHALGIPLRRGRFYTRYDRTDAPPVTLINETLARRHWPGEDPIGRRITVRLFGQTRSMEIVGVVGDVRHDGLDSDPRPEFFVPHLQNPYGSMTYVVRTAGDPLSLLPAIKEEIRAVNSNLPFASVATMDELFARSFGNRRFNLQLLGSFAIVALTLAGIGVYGLTAFSVRQRTRDIGVRMALGASPQSIRALVMSEGLSMAVAGVIAGVAGALALTRVLRGLLFGVGTTDPVTFAAVSALLVAIAALACYIPARGASTVDPLAALRCD